MDAIQGALVPKDRPDQGADNRPVTLVNLFGDARCSEMLATVTPG
jgi:hypothetical protein